MKIAIKGHLKRGKDVVQILENLGGVNRMNHTGCCDEYFYYISVDSNTIVWTSVRPIHLSVFTLEEFETQFPFKIGDKVRHITSIGTIRKYCYIDNKPGYEVESMELGIIANIPAEILEPYEEMKEERNIKLTFDKAKEWYQKGGELKEIALQAFSEEELKLNPLPRSWAEFCINHPVKFGETYIGTCSKFISRSVETRDSVYDRYVCPSRKSAEAHLALIQLEQLRNCWWNGWKPEWDTKDNHFYTIHTFNGKIECSATAHRNAVLIFPTEEMRDEFYENFKSEIESCKELL